MKIAICGSIEFVYEIKSISEKLIQAGHQTEIPLTCQRILKGELTLEEFKKEKEKNGDGSLRKIKDDVIKRYYNSIKNCDAILIVNVEKRGINGYIGGNTFLEMGFAYILDKKIFLLNPVPKMSYTDEILAMQPNVINGDLNKII